MLEIVSGTLTIGKEVHVTSEAFAAAYKKGFILTVRFLISRGLDFDTAQEMAQATWVKAWEKIDQLQEEEMIQTWVISIAINVHLTQFRSERRHPLEEIIQHPWFCPNFEIKTEVEELVTPSERAILRARYIEEHSIKEVALATGTTISAIKSRTLRSCIRIKNTLAARSREQTHHGQNCIGEAMNGAPNDIKVSISPGMKILVAGNGVGQFRKNSDDKVIFWDIPEINRFIEAPEQVRVPNVQTVVILRGMRERQTLAVQNFGHQNGIEIKYTDNKGQVMRLMEQIRLNSTTDPVQPLSPFGEDKNPPKQQSLEEVLAGLQNIYVANGRSLKATTTYVRSLGFTKDRLTDGALYQRVRSIAIRLGDIPNPKTKQQNLTEPTTVTRQTEALVSSQAKELLEAIAQARVANQRVLELAAAVANENAQLQEKVDSVRKLFGS